MAPAIDQLLRDQWGRITDGNVTDGEQAAQDFLSAYHEHCYHAPAPFTLQPPTRPPW